MRIGQTIGGLVALVALSSYLGLAGRFFFFDLPGSFEFVAAVWSDSLVADLVFVAGTVSAGVLSWQLAQRNVFLAVLVGAVAHTLVYWASFLLLDEVRGDTAFPPLEALQFVATWGFVGLAVAAIGPPAAFWWMARRRVPEAAVPA